MKESYDEDLGFYSLVDPLHIKTSRDGSERGVKEVKPQGKTPFKWPDYWIYTGHEDIESLPSAPVEEISSISIDPFEKWLEEDMRPKQNDNVKHPSHYNQDGKIECIDAIKAALGLEGFAAYCRGNTLKYLWRYQYKGGLEDLKKATQYLEWLIETEEEIKSCSSQQ